MLFFASFDEVYGFREMYGFIFVSVMKSKWAYVERSGSWHFVFGFLLFCFKLTPPNASPCMHCAFPPYLRSKEYGHEGLLQILYHCCCCYFNSEALFRFIFRNRDQWLVPVITALEGFNSL
jgi:hypothetical protein